ASFFSPPPLLRRFSFFSPKSPSGSRPSPPPSVPAAADPLRPCTPPRAPLRPCTPPRAGTSAAPSTPNPPSRAVNSRAGPEKRRNRARGKRRRRRPRILRHAPPIHHSFPAPPSSCRIYAQCGPLALDPGGADVRTVQAACCRMCARCDGGQAGARRCQHILEECHRPVLHRRCPLRRRHRSPSSATHEQRRLRRRQTELPPRTTTSMTAR
ncbi:unnamed protein product, partial [Urochloa humidicola]